jgi:hypothetical protein
MTVSVKLGLGLAAWMRGVGLGEGVRVGGTGVSVETRGVTASPPQAEVINKIIPQIISFESTTRMAYQTPIFAWLPDPASGNRICDLPAGTLF